jgi:hypothetical protein
MRLRKPAWSKLRNVNLGMIKMRNVLSLALLPATLLGMLLTPTPVTADEASITNEEIDAAITVGKSNAKLEPYHLSGFFVGDKGYVLTPFLRVATAARIAAKKYETFSRADVSDEMLTSLIDIVVPAYDLSRTDKHISPVERFVNVETVLFMPKGSKDTEAAIRPVRTVDDISILQNAFGMKIETNGVVAKFPRSAFRPGYELVIIYEHRLGGGKQEFRGEFKENDLRSWR